MRGDGNDERDGDSDPDVPPHGLFLLLLSVIFLVVLTSCATSYVHPRFSIEIQGLEGLDPSRNSTAAASAPAFNLTVHVDNKHHLRRVCLEETTVIVYYNEASVGYNETSVGWSELPAFCVDRWSAVDLGVVTLPKDGVFLSQTVREKMARDRQDGGIKLSVEIKPIDPEDGSKTCFQSCDPRLGESPVAVSCSQYC